jgi:hypothetical protein
MGAINTAAYLATIRSRMDAQQQVVALLESELQKSILGDNNTTMGSLTGVSGSITNIYKNITNPDQMGFSAGVQWLSAINDANTGFKSTDVADQDALRQLLYQARALLGELRVEEQAWNGEVNSEKTLRKDVNDFAKL